ncbi:MAG: D-lyxose/D-mannose family sugar isomerase [Spirochaetaceae bacterium]|nr:MAG: D-lyxose/D-mannose family sugar isomerase [Spirochaetaceae bacterium]
MKRSDVNRLLSDAKEFFSSMGFRLPAWAHWGPADWKGRSDTEEIVNAALGWDVTDFGSGEYEKRGLLLFAIRNGLSSGRPAAANLAYSKPYAEKIMIVDENQETPFHFHWNKMEDIINRGGGNLVLELFMADGDEEFSDAPVTVSIDGIIRTVPAGGTVVLHPGESITLYQNLYHRFYGEQGRGRVLVGEVSTVNDDSSDNRFKEAGGRYPALIEDEEPLHLLVSDYAAYLD